MCKNTCTYIVSSAKNAPVAGAARAAPAGAVHLPGRVAAVRARRLATAASYGAARGER